MVLLPKYILILFFLITADYFLGIAIENAPPASRRKYLILSILFNIGTLFVFKYFNFFSHNVFALSQFLHWNYSPTLLNLVLPLGLSFHVFQSLSYVIEVFRGTVKSERNYIHYALYVMFFPQLVAGPIERPGNLLPQIAHNHEFNAHMARRGLERMLWGFFKKLVIADNLAVIVNGLFLNLPSDGISLALLAVMFAYQLYCDFSGYTDIALGSAMVLGFNLRENFNRPFAAGSVGDFWHRWHMSLSSWFRDYVYIPLGGGRVTTAKWCRNILIVFVLSGLCHGANWTYAVWGVINGFYIIIGRVTEKAREFFVSLTGLSKTPRLHRVVQIVFIFALTCLAFVFFRASSIGDAWWIVGQIPADLPKLLSMNYLRHELFRGLGLAYEHRYIAFIAIALLEIIQYIQTKRSTFFIFDNTPKIIRYGWYYLLLTSILLFGYFGEQVFIYFQF